MDMPDISHLLGKISEKRSELPKTEIQHVTAVKELKSENSKTDKLLNGKTEKQVNSKTAKSNNGETRGIGGRPSLKNEGIEYVKISPRVPKSLKKKIDLILVEERFKDEEGRPITTLDEIVALALSRLVK